MKQSKNKFQPLYIYVIYFLLQNFNAAEFSNT